MPPALTLLHPHQMPIVDAALSPGCRVWCRQPAGNPPGWVSATLLALGDDKCDVVSACGTKSTRLRSDVERANPAMQDGVAKLTSLTYINEPERCAHLQMLSLCHA